MSDCDACAIMCKQRTYLWYLDLPIMPVALSVYSSYAHYYYLLINMNRHNVLLFVLYPIVPL